MHCCTRQVSRGPPANPLSVSAAQSIVNVIGMTKMTPPIKDLLPRLTPILKNRHEKVQENCIDLVGRIADRGAEYVPAREWMRICFELLEMLKAHKKGIRWAHGQGLASQLSVTAQRSLCSWNMRVAATCRLKALPLDCHVLRSSFRWLHAAHAANGLC